MPIERRLQLLRFRFRRPFNDVRPDERRAVASAFLTLGGFMVGHALLETARDALFLSRLQAAQLPWAYLAIGLTGLVLVQTRPRAFERLSAESELSAWLSLAALITFALWLLTARADAWVPYAVYVWSGTLSTLVVVRFWTTIGGLFTVTQAKRLFAVIGTGSVMGAIVGSGAARVITGVMPARHAILVAAVAFVGAAAFPRWIRGAGGPAAAPVAAARAAPAGRSIWDVPELARLAWSRPYVRRLATLILVSTVTLTFADFVFKSAVDRYVTPADMGAFFATVYLAINVLSLVAQTMGAAWMFRTLGVDRAQAVVPLAVLVASGGFLALGGLTMALLLKLADGALRHSVHRTGTELLFVPLSVDVRGRIKGVIDVLGQRGGQAIASLLILLTLALTPSERGIALVVAVGSGVWLLLALDLRRLYVDVFRQTLREGITDTGVRFPALDVASLESLVATLGVPDDARVRAALDILDHQGRARLIPPLMLYHPTPDIVLHTLDVFVRDRRDDFLPLLDRLLGHPDPSVRAASVRALAVMRPQAPEVAAAATDPAPEVAVSSLVALVARSGDSSAVSRLTEMLREGDVGARIATARAAATLQARALEDVVLDLCGAREVEVRIEAVRALGLIGSERSLPTLVRLLSSSALEHDVRAALVALGPPALEHLGRALADDSLPHAVRRRLPSAVRAFASPAAVRILERRLVEEPDGMIRFKILRALGRLQSEGARSRTDPAVVSDALASAFEAAFRFLRWRRLLEAGSHERSGSPPPVHELLHDLVRDKEDHAVERIFRLLNLQTRKEEFHVIHRGLQSPSPEIRAGSRELAEKLAPAEVRRRLVTLLDDLYDPSPEAGEPEAKGWDDGDVLLELLDADFESLSSVAARAIAESGRVELAEALRRREPLTPEHERILTSSLRTLEVGGVRR